MTDKPAPPKTEFTATQFNAMSIVAESLRKFQDDHAAVMRSITQRMDIGKTLAAQVAEATRSIRGMSLAIVLGPLRPIQEMARAHQTMLDTCLKPIQEVARLREQVLAQAMRPLRDAMPLYQRLLHGALKPLHENLAQVANSLQDYAPSVQNDGETLTVDGQTFHPEDITRIKQEFIFDQADMLVRSPLQVMWEHIPPATRWVIQTILAALISMILQCMFLAVPNKTLPQVSHDRKVEVRRLSRNLSGLSAQELRPFVNKERLAVHVAPRRQSRVVAVLAYPQQVTILEYRKKKRWVLVEWEDFFDNTYSGWVLGRYVFRMPGQKEALDD